MGSALIKHMAEACSKYESSAAYRFGEETITYRELLNRAIQFSDALAKRGISKGSKLLFYCDNLLDTVIGYFGCLIGGVIVVPLNMEDDVETILPVISLCDAELFFVSPSSHAQIAPHLIEGKQQAFTSQTLGLVKESTTCDHKVTRDMESSVSDSDLAFIFFTSGSTGSPKGVMLSHGAIAFYMMNGGAGYDFRDDDVFLCQSAMHSDMSLFSLFISLCHGTSCVLVPPNQRWNPACNIEIIRKNRVSILMVVPSFLRLLISYKGYINELSTARILLITGEKIFIQELNSARRLLPHVRFINLYGSSECNDILSYQIPLNDLDLAELPLGTPLPYVNAFLFNETMQECAEGEVGELVVDSKTLMKGYYGRESDPFLYMPGRGSNRYYPTGDLMVQKAGLYYYVERKDHMVKVNGTRVYPAVIESVLLLFPGILEAVVISFQNKERPVLVAFIYGVEISSLEVRKHCAKHLLSHYIPSEFVIGDTPLPKNSTGKVNSKQISYLYRNRS